MIAKGDMQLPDDEENHGREQGSHGESPGIPKESGKGGSGYDEYPILGGDKATARLIARAARNRWGTSRRMRRKCVEFTEGLIDDGLKGNVTIGIEGVSLALKMEGQNQKDQMPESGQSIQVNVAVANQIQAALTDAERSELLERRAMAADCHPGTIRPNGERRQVEDGGTSSGIEPGTN